MTREELIAQRTAAGATYAAAAAAYLAAYEELHAHDIALNSVLGGFPEFQPPTPHGSFLRNPIHGGSLDRVMVRVKAINNSLEG